MIQVRRRGSAVTGARPGGETLFFVVRPKLREPGEARSRFCGAAVIPLVTHCPPKSKVRNLCRRWARLRRALQKMNLAPLGPGRAPGAAGPIPCPWQPLLIRRCICQPALVGPLAPPQAGGAGDCEAQVQASPVTPRPERSEGPILVIISSRMLSCWP